MREIRVAVVGCGFVANDHLTAWKKTKRGCVTVVCDLNESVVKRIVALWKIPKYYTSFLELIEDGHIDVLDLCTPPQTHATLAVQAMKSGHHVLLEKPMTMTARDAEEIVRCQERTGVKAGVVHNWLFESPVIDASFLVKNGHVGEVINVDVEVLSTRYDSMAANRHHWCHKFSGGRFSEMLAHPIYLVRHFLGEVEVGDVRVSKIGDYAWMKSDELCATLNVGNKLGTIYASFNAPRDAIFVNLYGTEAILKLDVVNATVVKLPKRQRRRFDKGFDSLRQATQLVNSTVRNMTRVFTRRWLSGHEMCIKLFAESLANNGKIPVTAEDGYVVVKSLEEMCNMIEKAEKERDT